MKKMTGRERLMAAMKGIEPDRVPVSPRLGAYLMGKYGRQDLDAYLELSKQHEYDITYIVGGGLPDPIFGADTDLHYAPSVKVESEAWYEGDIKAVRRRFHTPAGILEDVTRIPPAGREYGISPNPFKTEHLIKEADDLQKLAFIMPDPVQSTDASAFFRSEQRLGDAGITQLLVRGPVDHLAGSARGMENLMIDYYEDRSLFDAILEFFFSYIMKHTRACMEAGVKNIFASWYFTSLSAGWSPAIFKDAFLPLIKKHVELVHEFGGIYDYYDDGKCNAILDFIGESGADVFETLTPPPIGDIDLAATKKSIGDRICLKGYVDLIYVLMLGTPELVRETVKTAISQAAPGGRFIIGTSDSIRDGTPDENVAAYFNAAREFGNYPIMI